MIITKQYKSETAHIVRGASSERCQFNYHGHRYIWEISIEGPRQSNGMVIDFTDLKPIKMFIDMFDHASILWDGEEEYFKKFYRENFKRVLIMKSNTTAENMVALTAKWIDEWLYKFYPQCKLHKVRIWETDSGSAESAEYTEYTKDDILVYTSEDCLRGLI